MPGNKKSSAPKKKVKKVTSKKAVVEQTPVEQTPVVDTPVVDTPVADTPVADTVVADNSVDNYQGEFTHMATELKNLQTGFKNLMTYMVKFQKQVARDQRVLQKRVNGKRRRTNPNASPSGFSKPGQVSDELRTFLKLGKDDLIARTEVTKRINTYCKQNGLQGEKDKRILKPDKALQKLLRIGKGDELTFFNLQKYMKVHFPNKEGVYPTA